MKQVAVMCALPSERNTGMATVDLAAHTRLPKLFPQTEFTYYAMGKLGPYAFAPGELPFVYRDVTEDPKAFFQADAWLYWGDFIHAHSYWKFDRGQWDTAADRADQQQLLTQAQEIIFLKSQPDEALKRAVLFGGTIITNDATCALDTSYHALSQRLFRGAGGVYFRDPLSAAHAATLRPGQSTLACDCAMLLEDDDLHRLPEFSPAPARRGVGVFFARSPGRLRMLAFSRLLARKLGCTSHWLPWFPTWGVRRLEAEAMGYCVPKAFLSPGAILAQLSGCEYVITDTYHLAVNAWRMNIPAVCIGAGAVALSNSLSDKKKEILYEAIGARQFYVYTESLSLTRYVPTLASTMADRLRDQALVGSVRAQYESCRAMGLAALRSVL